MKVVEVLKERYGFNAPHTTYPGFWDYSREFHEGGLMTLKLDADNVAHVLVNNRGYIEEIRVKSSKDELSETHAVKGFGKNNELAISKLRSLVAFHTSPDVVEA